MLPSLNDVGIPFEPSKPRQHSITVCIVCVNMNFGDKNINITKILYRVAPKCKPLTNYQKIVLNHITACQCHKIYSSNWSMIQSLLYHFFVLDILCVTYFLTTITMLHPQNSDMRHALTVNAALPLASARLSKLWILCLNDLLDRDLSKKFFYFHIYSFLLSNMILLDAWVYPYRSFKPSNTASDDDTK